jgi:hypothetical protein
VPGELLGHPASRAAGRRTPTSPLTVCPPHSSRKLRCRQSVRRDPWMCLPTYPVRRAGDETYPVRRAGDDGRAVCSSPGTRACTAPRLSRCAGARSSLGLAPGMAPTLPRSGSRRKCRRAAVVRARLVYETGEGEGEGGRDRADDESDAHRRYAGQGRVPAARRAPRLRRSGRRQRGERPIRLCDRSGCRGPGRDSGCGARRVGTQRCTTA